MAVSRAISFIRQTNPEESFTVDDEPEISRDYKGLKVQSNAFSTNFQKVAKLSLKQNAIRTRQKQYYQKSREHTLITYTTKK